MMTVEMTWDEFRTLVYGMYVRDFYRHGDDLRGMEPVCYGEFLDEEYLSIEDTQHMIHSYESGWVEIYLDDPLVKEVLE